MWRCPIVLCGFHFRNAGSNCGKWDVEIWVWASQTKAALPKSDIRPFKLTMPGKCLELPDCFATISGTLSAVDEDSNSSVRVVSDYTCCRAQAGDARLEFGLRGKSKLRPDIRPDIVLQTVQCTVPAHVLNVVRLAPPVNPTRMA